MCVYMYIYIYTQTYITNVIHIYIYIHIPLPNQPRVLTTSLGPTCLCARRECPDSS